MGLIAYLILCALVGLLVWLLVNYVPMPSEIKRFLPIAAVVVLALILLLNLLGLPLRDVPIPRLR